MKRDSCAVVLGGSTAGYSIIHELHAHGVAPIVLVDKVPRPASRSRKIESFHRIDPSPESLRDTLLGLHRRYDWLVLFPTFDDQLEQLEACYDELEPFCYLPFNRANLRGSMDKIGQYEACERLGVPYPRTRFVRRVEDFAGLEAMPFPLLLKPQKKHSDFIDPLSELHPQFAERVEDLPRIRAVVEDHLAQGIQYLASEFVPGEGSNVHAYVGLRTADGRILNEWVGKKLSQYPHELGVFASASNQCPAEVAELGRRLLHGMDLYGIVEPEFKYDARDGRFKLMEINLRSMGWVHIGYLSGVPLHYCQFLHATGQEVPRYVQDQTREVHLIQLQNEVSNLLYRRSYWPTFRRVFGTGDRRVLTLFDVRDLGPFRPILEGTVLVILGRLRRWLCGGTDDGPARPEAP